MLAERTVGRCGWTDLEPVESADQDQDDHGADLVSHGIAVHAAGPRLDGLEEGAIAAQGGGGKLHTGMGKRGKRYNLAKYRVLSILLSVLNFAFK